MITLGKRGDLHARRQAAAFVRNEIASENYDEATDKYTSTTALQNCSLKLHLVMQNVMVDILVSLKLNHVVVMLHQWQLSNLYKIINFVECYDDGILF